MGLDWGFRPWPGFWHFNQASPELFWLLFILILTLTLTLTLTWEFSGLGLSIDLKVALSLDRTLTWDLRVALTLDLWVNMGLDLWLGPLALILTTYWLGHLSGFRSWLDLVVALSIDLGFDLNFDWAWVWKSFKFHLVLDLWVFWTWLVSLWACLN